MPPASDSTRNARDVNSNYTVHHIVEQQWLVEVWQMSLARIYELRKQFGLVEAGSKPKRYVLGDVIEAEKRRTLSRRKVSDDEEADQR